MGRIIKLTERDLTRLVIGKYLEIDYEGGGSIQFGREGNSGSMFIAGLLRGESNVIIEKI